MLSIRWGRICVYGVIASFAALAAVVIGNELTAAPFEAWPSPVLLGIGLAFASANIAAVGGFILWVATEAYKNLIQKPKGA